MNTPPPCRYPVDYHESLNTVLCQELVRFNRLIHTMHTSLEQLQKAIKGVSSMQAYRSGA